ncbi:MAG: 7-carboxy-7-deazaguanine synthase QueE, partial [Candidatus Promineifilaceae bacterium]
YPVNNIYTCVQGEGVQTGVAMVLLRLHGCAVGCPWCDTKETWEFDTKQEVSTLDEALGATIQYVRLSAKEICDYIIREHPGPKWVLLTGGEPAQFDVKWLVQQLQSTGYQVAIETSGTELGHINAGIDWVCVSPKLNMPGGKIVQTKALASADELKHVVGRQRDITLLDELLGTFTPKSNLQICLQPISQSAKATQICIDTVQQRGWRLSVQMHKYVGVE